MARQRICPAEGWGTSSSSKVEVSLPVMTNLLGIHDLPSQHVDEPLRVLDRFPGGIAFRDHHRRASGMVGDRWNGVAGLHKNVRITTGGIGKNIGQPRYGTHAPDGWKRE